MTAMLPQAAQQAPIFTLNQVDRHVLHPVGVCPAPTNAAPPHREDQHRIRSIPVLRVPLLRGIPTRSMHMSWQGMFHVPCASVCTRVVISPYPQINIYVYSICNL